MAEPDQEPTGSLDYHTIENAMRSCINWARGFTKEFAVAGGEYASAQSEYDVQFAIERFKAKTQGWIVEDDDTKIKITDDMAKDMAVIATQHLYRDAMAAKAKLDAVRQRMLTAREELEAHRSLMASYRETGSS